MFLRACGYKTLFELQGNPQRADSTTRNFGQNLIVNQNKTMKVKHILKFIF
jgi:hypothetical protein